MLQRNLRVLYLHGFASSPHSRKAQFFAAHLPSLGFQIEIPDLAPGNFEKLTLTGQLEILEEAARSEPVILIGSSLGGYLASIYAGKHPEVERLILLAPAFGMYDLWCAAAGPERLRAWRETGSARFYHYGQGREVPLGFQFLEDAQRYPAFPDFRQRALLIHGRQDPVVPVQQSVRFAEMRSNVELIQMDAGHELTEVLPEVWERTRKFLTT